MNIFKLRFTWITTLSTEGTLSGQKPFLNEIIVDYDELRYEWLLTPEDESELFSLNYPQSRHVSLVFGTHYSAVELKACGVNISERSRD